MTLRRDGYRITVWPFGEFELPSGGGKRPATSTGVSKRKTTKHQTAAARSVRTPKQQHKQGTKVSSDAVTPRTRAGRKKTRPPAKSKNKRNVRKVYHCRLCHQPKRNHTCTPRMPRVKSVADREFAFMKQHQINEVSHNEV